MALSAIINSVFFSSTVSMIKWFLLAELITLLLYAFAKDGLSKVSVALAIVYLYPIVMLVMSLVFGVSKASEADGSTSYTGDFFHESVFSIIIYSALIFFLVVCKEYKVKGHYVLLLIAVFTVFLVLVNYRTTLLAEVVLLAFTLVAYYWKGEFSWRFVIISGVCALAFSIVYYNYDLIVERFSDLPEVLNVFGELIASPELFTVEETKLLSGRLYIWSSYVDYVIEGSMLNQFFGYGMDSWDSVFLKYAHNTFISFYFELGLIGVSLLIWFILVQLKVTFYIYNKDLKKMFLGFFLSFLALNLSTMPLWAIEGVVIFAYISAAAIYLSSKVVVE